MSRKLDLSAFAGDDEEEDEAAVFLPKTLALNQLKTKTFSHGITKKSKKDLEREAEERKRKEEEEALAKLNAELETFESTPSGGMRGFGPGMSRGKPQGSGFVRAGGAAYQAVRPPVPPSGPSNMPPQGPAAMMGYRPYQARAAHPPAPAAPVAAPKPKGKRAMDSFLNEIKSNQEAREFRLGQIAKMEGSSVTALAAWESNPAGKPAAAPQIESTNLYITSLPTNVNEESLGMFFVKYGPIGTVKIMWPRGEAEWAVAQRGRGSLTGFVNFMNRDDAAVALNEMDGIEWGGSQIRVAWGKQMPLPAEPIYDVGAGSSKKKRRSASPGPSRHRESRTRRDSRSDSDGSASPPPRSSKPKRGRSYSASSSRSRSPSSSRSPSPPRTSNHKSAWLDQINDESDSFVRAVANRVKTNGKAFEELLREKEKGNPKFAFLFKEELPEYHLFKYTVNPRYRFPPLPTSHFDDTGYASLYSSDSAEDSEKERTEKGKLGRLAKKRLEAMLRAMSGTRVEIARAMEFALKRAEAADEIAEVIIRSLRVDGTPVPRKLARLHLVSDILHNSASPVPNVWRYRLAFEKRLPPVFAHLSTVYQSLLAYSGQMSADVFKAQVMVVLDIWEAWIVYTQETSQALRQLFMGETTLDELEAAKQAKLAAPSEAKAKLDKPDEELGKTKGFKSSGFKSSFKRVKAPEEEAEDILREALGGAIDPAENLDGEEMDLDGEEMDLDEEEMDLDGEPMGDDDLDGEPM